jgi:cytoskeletal protein CcmA (bactofilin family)
MKKSKTEINAFLGKDTEFEGKFSFTGMVRVDGRLSGEIFSNGTLVVGESAVIKAQIHVGDVIINGEVQGNIFAEDRIEVNATGRLFGNIETPKLIIEDGVIFEGNCKMKDLGQKEEGLSTKAAKKMEGISVLK